MAFNARLRGPPTLRARPDTRWRDSLLPMYGRNRLEFVYISAGHRETNPSVASSREQDSLRSPAGVTWSLAITSNLLSIAPLYASVAIFSNLHISVASLERKAFRRPRWKGTFRSDRTRSVAINFVAYNLHISYLGDKHFRVKYFVIKEFELIFLSSIPAAFLPVGSIFLYCRMYILSCARVRV